MPDAAAAVPVAAPTATEWARLDVEQVAAALGVDPALGLAGDEVERRRVTYGPNKLADTPTRPEWKKFLDQFRSGIVAILAAAAVLAGAVGDIKDTVVIAVVLVLNAILGYLQEAKAETAMAALERMLVTTVRVRRDGRLEERPIDELVPGDVVLLEPGDRVPADGRLTVAAGLSIDESALTGESVPVDKWTDAIAADPGVDLSIGDRANLAYLNTTVTKGRAELVVTETGMRTEMGKVAELLAAADPGPTPLEVQLDGLTRRLALIAVVAVGLVFALQLVQGVSFADAMLGAVALAVAAIPEGLPAVVTVTLAVGVSQMARRHAIVKRLHSVETLGSTTVICSDKTGTLTLNQMTAQQLSIGDLRIDIAGSGYGSDGALTTAGGEAVGLGDRPDLGRAVEVGALCNDAAVRGGVLVGDPTEGALVVLASKAGVDVEARRAACPRIGEVPFDSATKYMATFHADGDEIVCYVKGAPDRLLDRCATGAAGDGRCVPVDDAVRAERLAENDRLAATGLRVLALASRRYPADEVVVADGIVVDGDRYVDGLTLDGLVGILDPPRDEARAAIGLCHQAGIQVKMITGDHASTAGSIARSLGIVGDVVSGDELDRCDDAELARRIDAIGVCARVSPEHKVRVVRALKANGHVVAMTGDGVNDAAALRTADIGVAMGITGTEVTKEAADMVLADDNFASIVGAVELGRTIYANIVKFVRFQLSTNLGAIATILGASLLALPVPFSAIQVLWVNLIADGPPAITLGVDPPDGREMLKSPRASDAAILTARRIGRLLWFAAIMA
ncbi:MAG: cation-translocating P-type ATPase, partial [Acidimicrobiales bacterium]